MSYVLPGHWAWHAATTWMASHKGGDTFHPCGMTGSNPHPLAHCFLSVTQGER